MQVDLYGGGLVGGTGDRGSGGGLVLVAVMEQWTAGRRGGGGDGLVMVVDRWWSVVNLYGWLMDSDRLTQAC